jgi:peptidyl-tRNA hydrolase, PTH2 family
MGALLACAKKSKDREDILLEITDPHAVEWLEGKFTKICVYVETETGLFNLRDRCQEEGLPHALIQDSGMTEFKGELTYTALGIGPDDPDKIDRVTGELPLF